MAYDYLIDKTKEDAERKSLADHIRAKGNTSATLTWGKGFEDAVDAIDTAKPEQEKTVDITQNGDVTITPDVGKVLSSVLARVNVSGGGGGSPKPFANIVHRTWTPASDTKRYLINQAEQKNLALLAIVLDKFLDGYVMSVVCGVKFGFGTYSDDASSYRAVEIYGEDNPFMGNSSVQGISSIGLQSSGYTPNKPFKSGVTYHIILAYGPMDYS